jgi:D-proline reductase (dithiol) PrdB
VGLVQRKLEAAGFTTLVISNIPELTASVSVPRLAALGYPVGLPLGVPGDATGQLAVLRAALQAMETIMEPGTVVNLPFEWQEPEGSVELEPDNPPPIVGNILKNPLRVRNFIKREIPEQYRV